MKLSLLHLIAIFSLASCDTFNFPAPKPEGGFSNVPPATETEISGVSISLVTSTPSFEKRPTIAVSGLSIADSVQVFSDSACTAPISAIHSASTPSENIKVNTDAIVGLQDIYVQVSRGSLKTECNSLTVGFTLMNCPDGYAHVPEATGNGFCIMKYEAKAGADSFPESKAETSPWVNISALDAFEACDSLNTKYGVSQKYHLISNDEWMSVSKNIESVPENWIHANQPDEHNVVGSGCLKQGNVGDTGDGCGYGNGSSVDFGTSRNSLAHHLLSNGEMVWDLSGNVWEPVDYDKETAGLQIGPTSCDPSFTDIPSFICPSFPETAWKPVNGLETSYWGMGKLYGGTAGLILRSAAYYNYSLGGLYSVYMDTDLNGVDASTGFRCVYRP